VSVATEAKSAWFKASYDKIALVAILLGLLASAAVLLLGIQKSRRLLDISGQQIRPEEQKPAKPVDVSAAEQSLVALSTPFQAGQFTNRMFVSELRVSCLKCGKPMPYYAPACPFCGEKIPEIWTKGGDEVDSDADLLPDAFEQANGLNPYNPEDAHADADNDGFSNLEEYKAQTALRDPASFPPPIAKLRLANTLTTPFKLRFVAVQELVAGQQSFQLNLRTLERTYFAKVGTSVEGYKVERYDEAARTLVLTRDGKTIRLEKGKVINDQERVVQFVFLIDGSKPEARVGQAFVLRGRSYRLADVTPDAATVVDAETGKSHLIGRPTAAEESTIGGRGRMLFETGEMMGPPGMPAAPVRPLRGGAPTPETMP